MGEAYEFTVQQDDQSTCYVLSSQGVAKASRYRQKTIRWERIQTLWILKNSLILFYSDTGYWVLPLKQIPAEAKEFLMQQVHRIGVRTKSLS